MSRSSIWAQHALTPQGWQQNVRVDIDDAGRISSVLADSEPNSDTATHNQAVGLLLPAPGNLHSHAFQRAMAGMTEQRGPDPSDSFWTWRRLMYRFLDNLNPDDVEAITAFVQMEMLEAGYASVGEFHYLHHQPDGNPYQSLAEMSERIVAAASTTGIGLTLLPVQYEHGGCDGRALGTGQRRFGNSPERFQKLHEAAEAHLGALPDDANIGVAPHSLRAVSQEGLASALQFSAGRPFHIHVAEQVAEVDEIQKYWGARPVEWLLAEHELSSQWCLIHATQMLSHETKALAGSGATVGLCPITESSLGDGIFDGVSFMSNGGLWGVGSDSNIRISLAEELRTLEYSQRLRDKGRAMFAERGRSTGRVLFDTALRGAKTALQRDSGSINVGQCADLLAINPDDSNLLAVQEDGWLDAWIFAASDALVTDVWSCGRHLVTDGQHVDGVKIRQRYQQVMRRLKQIL